MTAADNRDERIAAYLDGAMSDDEAAAFEADMARDEALATAVERWLSNDALMRAAMSDLGAGAFDQADLQRLGLADPAQDNVVSLGAARARVAERKQASTSWRWVAALPVAAAIAAVAVLYPVWRGGNGSDLAQSAAFQTAMQTLPSAGTAMLEDGRALTPVLSFAAADGRYCREFRVETTDSAERGLTCRDSSAWSIVALVAAPHSSTGITTAGGEADADPLGDAYARLNASAPFDTEDESVRIQSGWTR